MRKILLFLFLILSFPGLAQVAKSPLKYFYVAPTGNDANSGTLESPLATFEGAQKLAAFALEE